MLITRTAVEVVESHEKWTFIIRDWIEVTGGSNSSSLTKQVFFCGEAFNEINLQFQNKHSVIKHQLQHKMANDESKKWCLINAENEDNYVDMPINSDKFLSREKNLVKFRWPSNAN